MNPADNFHKWVEWNEQDQVFIGKCPDLISGIHGDNRTQVFTELCEVVDEVIAHFNAEGRPLPIPRVRPMKEVV